MGDVATEHICDGVVGARQRGHIAGLIKVRQRVGHLHQASGPDLEKQGRVDPEA